MKPTTIVVGVLDSGIQIDHEDLKMKFGSTQKKLQTTIETTTIMVI